MTKETINVRINNAELAKALKKQQGDIVKVECKNGIPLDKYWRQRFNDMQIDQAVEIVKNTGKSKKEAD